MHIFVCIYACVIVSIVSVCTSECCMQACIFVCTCMNVNMYVFVVMHMCMSTLPVVHLAETHIAEVSGAAGACGVAGDLLVCDTDEQSHEPPPKSPSLPDCSPSQLSETQSQQEAEASATHPAGSSLSD